MAQTKIVDWNLETTTDPNLTKDQILTKTNSLTKAKARSHNQDTKPHSHNLIDAKPIYETIFENLFESKSKETSSVTKDAGVASAMGAMDATNAISARDKSATAVEQHVPSPDLSSVRRRNVSQTFTAAEVLKHDNEEDSWLIIDGGVYDVTKWIPRHPGGRKVITSLAGRDASDLMHQMHPPSVFKYLPAMKVGVLRDYVPSSYVQACKEFQKEVEAEGYFKTNYWWYLMKTGIVYALLGLTVYLFLKGHWEQQAWIQILGSVVFGFFLQQTAFLGHDSGHNCIFHDRFWDSMYGVMVGNFMTGISMAWWKDSHNVHHSVPNAYKSDPDIQHLPVFAVSSKYFDSVWSTYHKRVMPFDKISRFLVSYQQYLFYPVMALARFNLYAQGYILILVGDNCEWPKLEIVGIVFYWSWLSWMLSHCLSWNVLLCCLFLSHGISGILHVQICLSHFSMEITNDVTYKNDDEQFFDTQLKTCIDINCPRWMDWFHGGLQFQTAHHLFPRVPRHRLRQLRVKVEAFCQKFGRTYNGATFWDTNVKTIKCLEKAAQEARAGKFVQLQDSMLWEGMCAQG